MAFGLGRSISQFVEREITRSHYLIIEEHETPKLPYQLKLERLHQLCIEQKLVPEAQCMKIRQSFIDTAFDHMDDWPPAAFLVQAYLPEHMLVEKITGTESTPFTIHRLNELSQSPAIAGIACVTSWLDTDNQRFLFCLPVDVHALLIEADGALLAA